MPALVSFATGLKLDVKLREIERAGRGLVFSASQHDVWFVSALQHLGGQCFAARWLIYVFD